MGHTKRRRINHNCYCFLIGIHPHLQAIGVECAVRVFPTPEEGDPRPKLPKSRHKKIAVAAFVEHMALEKTFQSSLLCRRVFFFFGKKSIDFGQIHRILTSTIWPTCKTIVNAQPFMARPRRVERLFRDRLIPRIASL